MALPSKRAFITSLISSLPTCTPSSSSPLKTPSAAQKSTLLALHVLFPNDLLPALDLLDRGLVTRLTTQNVQSSQSATGTTESSTGTEPLPGNTATEPLPGTSTTTPRPKDDSNTTPSIYYVKSAQTPPKSSRFRDAVAATTHYEVNTLSWSCSCPAFVFSAFPAVPPSPDVTASSSQPADPPLPAENTNAETEASTDQENLDPAAASAASETKLGWSVGGLSLGTDVPMCKHLLACVLVEYGGFGGFVKTEGVSVEELAGWAAGWGG